MDTIVIKLVESLGLPGILFAIVYIISQQKIISIIKASDIERQFFTHEKRFIYKISHWIGMFLWTFLLTEFFSTYMFNKSKFYNIPFLNKLATVYVYVVIAASFIMYILKNNKRVLLIKKFLSRTYISKTIVIAFFYLGLLLYFIYVLITFIYVNNLLENKDIVILANSIVISLITPEIVKMLFGAWLNFEETKFYYAEGDNKWYLLKPLDNDVLIGDKQVEEKCERLRLIDLSELKKKEILVKRT